MGLTSIVRCVDLDEMTAFFVENCRGLVESIRPADSPREVMIRIGEARLCLRLADIDEPVSLMVTEPGRDVVETMTAPNGSSIEFRPDRRALDLPQSVPSLSIVRVTDDFGVGRAGMHYRDLLPDRWGGRFIASHIMIPEGGPVPDYVHFHRVRFQLIFCARGWVDVVYEDQGEPFRLEVGDCVLQPPEIRHRVLASSPGLEVIEIGCPAEHDTFVEHDITLPTTSARPDRMFGQQRFVRHIAADAWRRPWLIDGLQARDTGIGAATGGLGGAIVVEVSDVSPSRDSRPTVGMLTHHGEFVFSVVLEGSAGLVVGDDAPVRLGVGEAVAFPPGTRWAWGEWSDDFEMLQVALPDATVVRDA
jgi:mannose-6-phosphate isomerase-like protein (cupin superfamily)